jgi:hypothetical protein
MATFEQVESRVSSLLERVYPKGNNESSIDYSMRGDRLWNQYLDKAALRLYGVLGVMAWKGLYGECGRVAISMLVDVERQLRAFEASLRD